MSASRAIAGRAVTVSTAVAVASTGSGMEGGDENHSIRGDSEKVGEILSDLTAHVTCVQPVSVVCGHEYL